MTEPNANDDYTYRSQLNTAIDQLRLALKTADTGERIRLLNGALQKHGQCNRAARPVQRGRHATAPTRIGTAHPDYHGDNA